MLLLLNKAMRHILTLILLLTFSMMEADGFDPIKAKNQFVTIARKISILAKNYNITLALENLNSRGVLKIHFFKIKSTKTELNQRF